MLKTRFGTEIEFIGIEKKVAAKKVAEFIGGTVRRKITYNTSYDVIAPDGRVWQFVDDGNIEWKRRQSGRSISTSSNGSFEMASPLLIYKSDIEALKEITMILQNAGGVIIDSDNWTEKGVQYK